MGHHETDQYMHYRGPKRRREKKKGVESLFKEIKSENFTNLGRETNIQIQEAQVIPNKMKIKHSPQYIL